MATMREVQGELIFARGAGGSHIRDREASGEGIRFRMQLRIGGQRLQAYLTPEEFAHVITGALTPIPVELERSVSDPMTGLELVEFLREREKQPTRITATQARLIGYHDGLVGTAHVVGALSEWVLGCARPLSDEGKTREAVTNAYTAGFSDGCHARAGSF